MPRDYATVSQKVFHAYADSTRPDDSGDGLTLATAKKTIEAAVAILPDTAFDHVVLHLSGQFTLDSYLLIGLNINGNNKRFVIDGGSAVDVVAGPHTATSGTTTSVTDTTKNWDINEYQGYAIEILDGAAAGYICTIQSNTENTIVVGREWPMPGTPQYRIIRPATTITRVGSARWLYYTGKSVFRINFQRLRFIGQFWIGTLSGAAVASYVEFSDVVMDGIGDSRGFACKDVSSCILGYVVRDPENPDSSLAATIDRRGVSFRGTSATYGIVANCRIYINGPSVLPCIFSTANPGTEVYIASGVLLKKLELFRAVCTLGYNPTLGTISLITGSDDFGIEAKDSRITVSVIDTNISNSSSHGIKLDNSTLEFIDAKLIGSGNDGAGVYAINGSAILAKDGQESTLTGTVGDISVDGTSELMAWADVASGITANVIGEISVKEVV